MGGLRASFGHLGRFCYQRRWLVLVVAAILTVAAGALVGRLEIAMTWLDLVPADHPSVTEFYGITERFGAATDIVLAIENEDPERLKEIAIETARVLRGMDEHFRSVQVHQDRSFVLSHGLMLEKADQLEDSTEVLTNLDLAPFFRAVNDSFEKSYIGGEDSLEDDELRVIGNVNSLIEVISDLDNRSGGESPEAAGRAAAERYIDDMLYAWSADRGMLLVSLQPYISVNDIEKIGVLVPALRAAVATMRDRFPDTTFRLTGMHVIAQDEMETATSDSLVLTNIAFVIILLGFVVAFRMWGAPLLAMLTLSLGILWDLGLTALIVGRLNMLTAMMAVILLGLGVDYFIHILSGYTEGRERGLTGEDVIVYALDRVGTGVFIGGLTTAIAFSVLILVDMNVFKELGIVLALGVLCTMAVSFTVLPAILAVVQPDRVTARPRWVRTVGWVLAVITIVPVLLMAIERLTRQLMGTTATGGRSGTFARFGGFIARRPAHVLIAVLLVVILSVVFIPGNWFDQNIMNMEMKGLESVELQREIVRRYGLSDSAVVYTTPSLQEAQRLHDILDDEDLVGTVDSIASYLPSADEQAARLPYLRTIHARLEDYTPAPTVDTTALSEELDRFLLNLLEISEMATLGGQPLLAERLDGLIAERGPTISALAVRALSEDPQALTAFQRGFGRALAGYLKGMATPQAITAQDLPASITDRYISQGDGMNVSFVFAKTDIWDHVVGSPFLNLVQSTQPNTTGMPIFMKVLIEDTVRHGRTALLIALLAIVVLISADLREPRLVLLALSPLILGGILMLGVIGMVRYPFNIMMVSMLPLILGIGIDDGIHLLHRWRIEGDDFPAILGSVGKALFLTTFTTMVAFGSLVFAKMQAYVGMGLMLFVAMGVIYIMTVTFIPAVLQLAAVRRERHRKGDS